MEAFQKVLGEKAVHKEKEAICQQIASTILFSGALGLQANYHYFLDPVGGNFLRVDPEVYLRENIAKHLPDYAAAQQSRREFFSQLDAAQRKIYQSVVEYTCYLETVGPKLAHYFGYLLGNVVINRCVCLYGLMEEYLGQRIDLNCIPKSFSLG